MSRSSRTASLLETRIRGLHVFFVLVVWADGAQVRVGIGKIGVAYDGTAVEGRYVTHDPARQFASPYTYTNWNPTNDTDPNGACLWDACIAEAILIGAAIGFAVSAIQAGVNGASFGQAMEAGVIGGAMGGAMGAGLGVLEVAITPTLLPALHAIELAGGAYSTAEGFRHGQYVVGTVGVVSLAFGVYGLSKDFGAQPVGRGANGGISQEGQLRFAADEYDQSFSGVGGGGRIGPHHIMSVEPSESGPAQLADPLGGKGAVSSGFLRRDGSHHGALDIAAPQGTEIYAAHSGVVSYAGPGTGYGRYIDIQDFRFDLVTRYGHESSFASGMGVGTAVSRGQLIGYVGSVGYSTGPHLHFEMILGERWVDPRPFLLGR